MLRAIASVAHYLVVVEEKRHEVQARRSAYIRLRRGHEYFSRKSYPHEPDAHGPTESVEHRDLDHDDAQHSSQQRSEPHRSVHHDQSFHDQVSHEPEVDTTGRHATDHMPGHGGAAGRNIAHNAIENNGADENTRLHIRLGNYLTKIDDVFDKICREYHRTHDEIHQDMIRHRPTGIDDQISWGHDQPLAAPDHDDPTFAADIARFRNPVRLQCAQHIALSCLRPLEVYDLLGNRNIPTRLIEHTVDYTCMNNIMSDLLGEIGHLIKYASSRRGENQEIAPREIAAALRTEVGPHVWLAPPPGIEIELELKEAIMKRYFLAASMVVSTIRHMHIQPDTANPLVARQHIIDATLNRFRSHSSAHQSMDVLDLPTHRWSTTVGYRPVEFGVCVPDHPVHPPPGK